MNSRRTHILLLSLALIFCACENETEEQRLRGINKVLEDEVANCRRSLPARQPACANDLSDCHGKLTAAMMLNDSLAAILNLLDEGRCAEAAVQYNQLLDQGKVGGERTQVRQRSTDIITALLVLCGLGMLLFFLIAVFRSASRTEVSLRILALFTGLALYFTPKALGFSIPEFMLSDFVLTNPIVLIIGAAFHFAIGIVVARLVVVQIRQSRNVAMRIAVVIGVFSLTMFADLLAASVARSPSLTPFASNLAFVSGVGLYMLLRL